MANEMVGFTKSELSALFRTFKEMDDEAVSQAKIQSGALASYLQNRIRGASQARNSGAQRVAEGSRVKKSSKIGELSFGFASQKFSGGGTTQQLWGGLEFGSNKYKQFPVWSGREGRGSRGWFIYPTLRAEQPYIVKEWIEGFKKITDKWAD